MTQEARKELKSFLDELEALLVEIDKYPDWLPDDDEFRSVLSSARDDTASAFEDVRRELGHPCGGDAK